MQKFFRPRSLILLILLVIGGDLLFFLDSAAAVFVRPDVCKNGAIVIGAGYDGRGVCRDPLNAWATWVYQGYFVDGKFEGRGIYKCWDRVELQEVGRYVGDFNQGKAVGQGTLTLRGVDTTRSDWELAADSICDGAKVKEALAQACATFDEPTCKEQEGARCFWYEGQCLGRDDGRICPKITDKNFCGTPLSGTTEGSRVCAWNKDTGKCNTPLQAGLSGQFNYDQPGVFPNCAFDGTCDSINDLLAQQLGWANFAMGLAGGVAFLTFIIGGVTMILSFGSPERFEKGRTMLVSAVVGLIIVFGAYVLVQFILDALGVAPGFRGIN